MVKKFISPGSRAVIVKFYCIPPIRIFPHAKNIVYTSQFLHIAGGYHYRVTACVDNILEQIWIDLSWFLIRIGLFISKFISAIVTG